MKMNKLVSGIAAVGLALGLASSAHAGYQVLDGWGLQSSFPAVSNIGRLNLVSGSATVEQQVNGSGNVFVGAQFSEYGVQYSLSYTPENVVGAGDVGSPTFLGQMLTLTFTNVTGYVSEMVGSGFRYIFQGGNLTISNGINTASGSIIGVGGTASQTPSPAGVNGDSTIAAILSVLNGFTFLDSANNALSFGTDVGDVFFYALTNNTITGNLGAVSACSFDSTALCAKLAVNSAGDAFLVRVVPEPASVALFGLGLLGLGALRRRKMA